MELPVRKFSASISWRLRKSAFLVNMCGMKTDISIFSPLFAAATMVAAGWLGAQTARADSVEDLLRAASHNPSNFTAPATRRRAATMPTARQAPANRPAATSRPTARVASGIKKANSAQLPAATRADGPDYKVNHFVLSYKHPRAQLPSLESLLHKPLILAKSRDGYVARRKGGKAVGYPVVRVTLAEINAENRMQRFHSSALASMERQLVRDINRAGFIGVYVQVSAKDFRGLRDIRRSGDKLLHLVIHQAIVEEVRTIASGQGLPTKPTIDNGAIAFIRTGSPIQPATQPAKAGPDTRDVLARNQLDDFILRLNQQPGRQVSIALSPGRMPDSVILDYLVHETKPWMAYAQISNTGTPQTNDWVEQFGFIDNELTGHDDILNLNYDTAGFDSTQDVNGSYQFPIFGIDRLQARIFGGYQQYNASNVGLGNLNFNGRTSFGGGELILNFAQFRNIFLYSVLGAQYQHVTVDNISFQQGGAANLLLPYLSLRMDRTGKTSHQTGGLTLLGQYTNASSQTLNNLGRLNTDPTWMILQGNFTDSFYLEPFLDHRNFVDGQSTLANEILLRASGQEAFGQRLIPQQEVVIGGLYSVRGYPQSIVAGDNGIYGTVQYNLHIPRLFPVDPNPKFTLFGHIFRAAPQTPYGRPDWDLVVSAFVDGGVVGQSQQQSYETGSTLLSTGLGAKVVFEKNITAEVDWGIALHSVSPVATGQGGVSAGSSQFNFVFSVSY